MRHNFKSSLKILLLNWLNREKIPWSRQTQGEQEIHTKFEHKLSGDLDQVNHRMDLWKTGCKNADWIGLN
jgi:hypothetical protein